MKSLLNRWTAKKQKEYITISYKNAHLIFDIYFRLKFGLRISICTNIRIKICVVWGILSLKCVLIGLTITNLSMLCIYVLETIVKKVVVNVGIKDFWYFFKTNIKLRNLAICIVYFTWYKKTSLKRVYLDGR